LKHDVDVFRLVNIWLDHSVLLREVYDCARLIDGDANVLIHQTEEPIVPGDSLV
jgi:hypothetical protein